MLFAERGLLAVRLAGSGGQGVVLAATILGEAAVGEGLFAAGSSAYGSQARGGAASSDVIVSRVPIDYPHVARPDFFAAMSQEGYDESRGKMAPGGVIVFDRFFVTPADVPGVRQVGIEGTRRLLDAEGSAQSANVLFLGACVRLTGVVGDEALLAAVKANLDAKFFAQSRKAYELGKELAAAGEAGDGGG